MANKKKETAQQLLGKTSIELLRKFLEQEFKADAALGQRFAAFVSKPVVKQTASRQFEQDIKNEIEDIIKDAEGRHGFIDYHASLRFEEEMSNLLERIPEQAPTDELRVSLQMYIVRRLDEITIDDSAGVITGSMFTIMNDFQCIYEDEDSRETLFNACMEYIGSQKGYFNYCAEEIEDFVLRFEGEAFDKRIEAYLDAKIKALANERDDWNFRSGARKYVVKMLQAKVAHGADEKELLEFAKPLWKSDDVRKFFVERYIKEERFKEAIALLEEGLRLDKQWKGLISDHQKQLKDLYRQTGQQTKYIKMLRSMLEKSWDSELELFDELKSQYSAEEWLKMREEIFKTKIRNKFAFAQLLCHEGLTERLAKLVLDAKDLSLRLLDDYAADLPKEHTPQIISAYEAAYSQEAARANKRSDYENLVFITIKSVHKIKGGKELTDRLTRQWLELYKRRPAFCEVIRKFRMDNGMKE